MLIRFSAWVLVEMFMALPGTGQVSNNTKENQTIEQQLRTFTEDLIKAEVRGDLAEMDRLFTDDYVHTHSSGWIENKSEFMGLYRSGKRKYNAADISDVQVRFYGTSAVVNGREHINELNGDHHYLFLCVWVQQQGRWRVAAWVANPVPKNPGTPPNFR
jgi:hypothetical protein